MNDVDKKGRRRPSAKVDRAVQAQIGKELRAMYADVVNAPVPDQLLSLLNDLERGEGGKGG